MLLTDVFLLYGCFMVGLGLALLLNYPDPGAQVQRIAAHANDALQMALVVLAAGVLLGILAGTEMSSGMAHALIDVLPAGSASMLHLILGAFGVPLGMLFSPDAYYFALLPIVRDVATAAGAPAESVARAMLIGEDYQLRRQPRGTERLSRDRSRRRRAALAHQVHFLLGLGYQPRAAGLRRRHRRGHGLRWRGRG